MEKEPQSFRDLDINDPHKVRHIGKEGGGIRQPEESAPGELPEQKSNNAGLTQEENDG